MMNDAERLEQARRVLAPHCKVCPVCNGRACAGAIPGPGGKGTGATAQRNYSYLENHVKLHLDAVYEPADRDCSIQLFGKSFSAPIFAAPIGMVGLNWSPQLDEYGYAQAVVEGTKQAGTMAFTGCGPLDESFYDPLRVIAENGGWGIPTLKPWRMELVEERLRLVEQAGASAFAMDIDSAGLPHSVTSVHPMVFKSEDDLRRLAAQSSLPFLVKGIMTVGAALQAAQAGVFGIIVSNHGGRVLDHGLSTAEVLSEIREAVGDRVKILVDGGVRSGVDVFKMLALGADAVLIGRPYSVAAYGGGAEGVRLYTEKLRAQLLDTMAMTNCRSLREIGADKIRIV